MNEQEARELAEEIKADGWTEAHVEKNWTGYAVSFTRRYMPSYHVWSRAQWLGIQKRDKAGELGYGR